MDIPLELLGPYAYLAKVKPGFTSKTDTSTTSVVRRKSTRANFNALHKKPNHRFMRDVEAGRQSRQQEMEQHRKDRRSHALNDARKPMLAEMANGFNSLIHEQSNNEISALLPDDNSSSSKMEVFSVTAAESNGDVSVDTKNNNESSGESDKVDRSGGEGGDKNASMRTRKATAAAATGQDQNRKPSPTLPVTIKEARRDQLQKWKRQKEATQQKSKPAFKVGAPVNTKPVKNTTANVTTSTTGLAKSANNTVAGSSANVSKNVSSTAASSASINKGKPLTGANRQVPVTAAASTSRTVPNRLANGTATAASTSRTVPNRLANGTATAASTSRTVPNRLANGTAAAATLKTGSGRVAGTGQNGTQAKIAEDTRRVTRAMSKVTPAAPARTGVVGKPPTQAMKALNIEDKRKPMGVRSAAAVGVAGTGRNGAATTDHGKISAPAKVAASSAAAGVNKKAGPVVAATGMKQKPAAAAAKAGCSREKTPPPPVPVAPEPEQAVKKKPPKPKAIDDAYTELNGQFSDVCRKLGAIRTEWTKLKEEQQGQLSQDIIDDIYSALGKVHLLLGSKLPQFGQLLYAYLCKDENAEEKMHASDLQGWWDVAYLQIDSVYKIFEGLTELKNNNWIKPSPVPARVKKPTSSTEDENVFKPPAQPQPAKPQVKARPNQGLLAFLANKRRQLKSDSDVSIKPESMDIDPTPSSEASSKATESVAAAKARLSLNLETNQQSDISRTPSSTTSTSEEDPNSSRRFEGGFFSISSPVVSTPTREPRARRRNTSTTAEAGTPVISAVPACLRTPSKTVHHRSSGVASEAASLRRASLSMLGVRRSMGSLGKLGVVDIFVEKTGVEEDQDTSINI